MCIDETRQHDGTLQIDDGAGHLRRHRTVEKMRDPSALDTQPGAMPRRRVELVGVDCSVDVNDGSRHRRAFRRPRARGEED